MSKIILSNGAEYDNSLSFEQQTDDAKQLIYELEASGDFQEIRDTGRRPIRYIYQNDEVILTKEITYRHELGHRASWTPASVNYIVELKNND